MVHVGDVAPDFSGTDVVTNNPFKLSDHFGKVIFLALISPS
jgi:hypothetical protein